MDEKEQNPKPNQKIFIKFQMLQRALKKADSNNLHKRSEVSLNYRMSIQKFTWCLLQEAVGSLNDYKRNEMLSSTGVWGKKGSTEVGLRKQRNTVVKVRSDISDLEEKRVIFQEWLPFLQNS